MDTSPKLMWENYSITYNSKMKRKYNSSLQLCFRIMIESNWNSFWKNLILATMAPGSGYLIILFRKVLFWIRVKFMIVSLRMMQIERVSLSRTNKIRDWVTSITYSTQKSYKLSINYSYRKARNPYTQVFITFKKYPKFYSLILIMDQNFSSLSLS